MNKIDSIKCALNGIAKFECEKSYMCCEPLEMRMRSFKDGLMEEINKPEPILNKEEKEYLSFVIKPFKNRVQYIIKHPTYCNSEQTSIIVVLDNFEDITFPGFYKGHKYVGMELDKHYTLKELEIE